jgi:hypothetical protein
MIPPRMSRRLRWAQELGLGYVALFSAIGAWYLHTNLQMAGRAPPVLGADAIYFEFVILLLMWNTVCNYHVRLMLSAMQLRLPRAQRRLGLSLICVAVLCGGLFMAGVMLEGKSWQQQMPILLDALVLGLLFSLMENKLVLLCLCGLIYGFLISAGPGFKLPVDPRWGSVVVLVALLLWRLSILRSAWRQGDALKSLGHLMKPPGQVVRLPRISGASQSWVPTPRSLQACGAAPEPTPRGVMRAALGPGYRDRGLLLLVPLAALLAGAAFWLLWWRLHRSLLCCGTLANGQDPAFLQLQPYVAQGLTCGSVMLSGIAVVLLVTRIARLAEVFKQSGAELTELALLPGLGGAAMQHALLLRESLLRPLGWFGLWIGGLAGVMLLLLAQVHATLFQFLYVAVGPGIMFLMFAALGFGLLGGALDPAARWREWVWSLILILWIEFSGWGLALEPARLAGAETLGLILLGMGVAWVLLLAGLFACLLRWAWLYRRMPNPYCR